MSRANDILVVDDETEIVKLIAEVLGDEGYSVRWAHEGPTALAAVAEAVPALILLDYWMPGMTGADVLARLRDTHYGDVPVILMSAGTRADMSDLIGAKTFLGKPFDIGALLDCVAQFVIPPTDRSRALGE
jgi:CheY-like chemotaxis protein